MTPKHVGIVVPAHGYVEDFFLSAGNTEAKDAGEIIVVDDASDGKCAAKIQEWCCEEGWGYIRNRRQQLFTRTVNRGFRAMSPDLPILVECNTDIQVSPGWLDAMLAVFDHDPKAAVVGYDWGEPGPQKIEQGYATGHCVGYRRVMFEELGLLNEGDVGGPGTSESRMPFGCSHWGSDREICERARKAGWNIYRHGHQSSDEPQEVLVRHDHPGTSTRNDRNWIQTFDVTTLWKARSAL